MELPPPFPSRFAVPRLWPWEGKGGNAQLSESLCKPHSKKGPQQVTDNAQVVRGLEIEVQESFYSRLSGSSL